MTTVLDKWRGAIFAVFAIALLWPAMLDGSPLMFFDSPGYYNQGAKAAAIVERRFETAEARAAAPGPLAVKPDGEAISVRSIAYSVFTWLSSQTPLGLGGVVLLQALFAAYLTGLLYEGSLRREPGATTMLLVFLVVATSLPWFASYLMPDIFASFVLLVALIVVRQNESLSIGHTFALGALSTFAIASHYSHIPLALAIGVVAAGVMAFCRRLNLRAAGVLAVPVVLAATFNIAVSAVVFEAPSATPKRLPVLLARSIADGPARWYLEAHCGEKQYAVCELFETFPRNVNTFLFGPTGITQRAKAEQMARIRAEEMPIVMAAFAEYPLQQIWSLTRNVVLQTVSFGTGDFRWSDVRIEVSSDSLVLVKYDESADRTVFDAFELLQYLVVVSSVGMILWLALSDGLKKGRHNRELLLVVLSGLFINAAICGGLSAPADRYQGRVIWLLPVLAGLFWLERRHRDRVI